MFQWARNIRSERTNEAVKYTQKKFKIKILYFDFIHPWRIISIVVALNKVKWAHTKIDFGLMPKPNLRSSCLDVAVDYVCNVQHCVAASQHDTTRIFVLIEMADDADLVWERSWRHNWSVPFKEWMWVCVMFAYVRETTPFMRFYFPALFSAMFALHFVRRFCCWFGCHVVAKLCQM